MKKLTLTIDGVDATADTMVTALVDGSLDAARQYEMRFTHFSPSQVGPWEMSTFKGTSSLMADDISFAIHFA